MNNPLRRIDLNLLVTLDALLSEHNVTRAAERLHLSQPTVSVQLARLREVFGDPLLLPGPRGMRPTARADELREPLHQALESLTQAVAPSSPFNPHPGQPDLACRSLGLRRVHDPVAGACRPAVGRAWHTAGNPRTFPADTGTQGGTR